MFLKKRVFFMEDGKRKIKFEISEKNTFCLFGIILWLVVLKKKNVFI